MYIIDISILTFSIQCVIGHDDVAMVVVVRTAGMLKRITEQTDKLQKVKLIISNFQKNDNHILTTNQNTIELDDQSTIELDDEVIVWFIQIINFIIFH